MPDFSANVTSGLAPLPVLFTDQSLYTEGRAWFFGDETYTDPWIRKTASAGWSKRWGQSAVALPNGTIILMGGYSQGSGGMKNDTWQSTDYGATWTRLKKNAGWSPRDSQSAVAMSNGSIVLMGGESPTGSPSGKMNDVWLSTNNGATWIRRNANAGWSARYHHKSVVTSNGSIILMGGFDDSGGRNDTWQSTDWGKTWTSVNNYSAWSARWGHCSVAMPDGSIILTGGYDSSYGYRNDTWRSTDNGATWTRMNASSGWSARAYHSSVAMPDGSIVLMGGEINNYDNNDTWRSTDNGATWLLLNASSGWLARAYHSSVAMPDGSIVLMGGSSNDGKGNDTWRFQPAGSSATNPLHTYTVPGIYSVALQARNSGNFGVNSTRKINYITAMSKTPTVTGITPATGINTTSISITNLAGTDFLPGAKVMLTRSHYASISATSVTVVSPTNITCRFNLKNRIAGPYNVVVTNPYSHPGKLVNGFTITAPTSPTITGIMPSHGVNTTSISIKNLAGTNFVDGATVKLNRTGYADIPGSNVTVVSPTKITCAFNLNHRIAGRYNVVVTNPDSQAGILRNGFTVTAMGADGVGVFHPATHTFSLKNGSSTTTVNFGTSADLPVSGDWNGDGLTDVGVFNKSTHRFSLKNGSVKTTVIWGTSADLPVSGDWNGDGLTDVGVFNKSTHIFSLKNGSVKTTVNFGTSADLPVSGDWNGDGLADVGVFHRSTHSSFSLKNGSVTTTVSWGASTDLPVSGRWS